MRSLEQTEVTPSHSPLDVSGVCDDSGMDTVIFACVHNAGRSQMAAALFNRLVDPGKAAALSAGTSPGERVHPEVLEVMAEVDVDLSDVKPRKLTADLASGATHLITMGCGESCPYVPGARVHDWPVEDPKGRPIAEVRRIRAQVEDRVRAFLTDQGWLAQKGHA